MRTVINRFRDKENLKNLFIFLLGLVILAFNYNVFVYPNKFNVGGMTGVATILNYLCGLEPAYFIFGSSIFLVILSYFTLDKNITYNSVIGAIMYPLLLEFLKPFCAFISPYFVFSNIIITLIIAGALLGLGSGLVYKSGYTTGGSDIIMKILNKYQHLTDGNANLLMNTIIVLLGAIVFGVSSVIYSIIILIISTNIVDKILIGISSSKMFLVSSKKYKQIEDYVIDTMHTGVTILDATGGFLFQKRKILMVVVPTRMYNVFKEEILLLDKDAFIVVSDCYEVTGGQKKKNSLEQTE